MFPIPQVSLLSPVLDEPALGPFFLKHITPVSLVMWDHILDVSPELLGSMQIQFPTNITVRSNFPPRMYVYLG
jgi:hypothetical protein